MTENIITENGEGSDQPAIEVAVTGSPNTINDVHFDVRSTHLRNPLLGTLVTLKVPIQSSNGNEELILDFCTLKTEYPSSATRVVSSTKG